MSVEASSVLIDGPWRHRFVSANGSRFHVAEAGPDDDADAPLVILLHGFPQFWWAWRHQIAALAQNGFHVAALDLRGYGASDKPPRGYDTLTLCDDVAGVIRSLGRSRAVIVGHGWGAWIAWTMPSVAPDETAAIAVLATAHPLRTYTAIGGGPRGMTALRHAAWFQLPIRPERRLVAGGLVSDLLERWSGAQEWPSAAEAQRYESAITIPSVAHCAMEYYRWAFRSRVRADGLRFSRVARARIRVPVLQLHGSLDQQTSTEHAAGSRRWVAGPYDWRVVVGAGHFLAEEAPETVNRALLGWLQRHRSTVQQPARDETMRS